MATSDVATFMSQNVGSPASRGQRHFHVLSCNVCQTTKTFVMKRPVRNACFLQNGVSDVHEAGLGLFSSCLEHCQLVRNAEQAIVGWMVSTGSDVAGHRIGSPFSPNSHGQLLLADGTAEGKELTSIVLT